MPFPSQADQRLLRRRELAELLLGQLDVPDRESPVERRDRVFRQEAGRHHRRARRDEVHADFARRRNPLARQPHGNRELLEPRTHTPEKRADGIRVQLHGGGRVPFELDPGLGEDRLDRLETPLEPAPRVAVAQEREDILRALAEKRRRQRKRGVVGCLEPQREHDRAVVGAHLVVEPDAEIPRRARPAREPAVDPCVEPALERGVARVRRQLGVGRQKAREEALCGTGRADRLRCGDSGRAQCPPRELVDGAPVEVVDERVDVSVEGVGARRRRRMDDRVELVAHMLVHRRAPQRVPSPVGRLEVRMDETGVDRAPGDVEHGKDGTGRSAQGNVIGQWGTRKAKQLVELEPPDGNVAAEQRGRHDGRLPGVQAARCDYAAGIADEREGAGVVLPQQLEQTREAVRGVGSGAGHEPTSIGSIPDAGTDGASCGGASRPRRRRPRRGSPARSGRP